MKLIRNLGRKLDINSGRYESYAIFWCDFCKSEVEKTLSNGKKAKSCGCHIINYKHGEIKTRLYNIWSHIKQRCLNPKNKDYPNYGGRGITICNEWLAFIPFRDWALNTGYKEHLIIDRKNPDGNYIPLNCRWLTILESNRNKTNTITMEIANEIRKLDKIGNYTRKELAEMFNINLRNLYHLLANEIWVD